MSPYGRVLSALLVALLLAGCVTGTVETTVDDDGTLAESELELDVDRGVYAVLESEARSEGYDDIEDRMTAESDRIWEEVEYTEEETDDGIRITQRMSGGDPNETTDLEVRVDDDEVLFIDHEGPGIDDEIDAQYGEDIDLTWIVHMPGEIVQTNGEVREDNRSVEWTFADHADLEEFAVSSERPQESDDASAIGGLLPTLAILLTLVTLAIRR